MPRGSEYLGHVIWSGPVRPNYDVIGQGVHKT